MFIVLKRGSQWHSWLRQCTTSRKVAGSIPDGVFGIFFNPSAPLWLRIDSASNRTQYQAYLLGIKGGRCVGLTNLPPSCANSLEVLGASNSWSRKGPSRPLMECYVLDL
jgi:hypothetical protein